MLKHYGQKRFSGIEEIPLAWISIHNFLLLVYTWIPLKGLLTERESQFFLGGATVSCSIDLT